MSVGRQVITERLFVDAGDIAVAGLACVLDVWRIGVNSHMAHYHLVKLLPDRISLYMLDHSGKLAGSALEIVAGMTRRLRRMKRNRKLMTFLRK